jgi:HEAT repeat protein
MSHPGTKPDPHELVARLASDPRERGQAFEDLVALGVAARDAVREGLGHANWEVRRWCAIWLDRHADPESLRALVPLLRDPKSKVRLFAVHAIACERCRSGENPIDVVPLLVERIRIDESIRVRRHAVAMLASQHAHADLEGFFQELLDTETDSKLHKHAGIGLMMCRRPDLTVPEAARLAARQIRRGEGPSGTA